MKLLKQDLPTDRTLALYGYLFGVLGTFGVLFFWIIATILLLTNNGGTIIDLALSEGWRTAYFAYPLVALGAAALGGVLFLLKRDLMAVAVAGAPVVLTALYYFALTLRGPIF